MFSPSNSAVLMAPGDVCTLLRDPSHDAVGVQVYGDGDGFELFFEGGSSKDTMQGLPSEAMPGAETIQPTNSGRYVHIVQALGVPFVQVRLGAITRGTVKVAIYTGDTAMMKAAGAPGGPVKPTVAIKMKAPSKAEAKAAAPAK